MELRDGITALIYTFNNEKEIRNVLESISKNKINQLIVADGGSNDQTRQISRIFTKYVIKSEKGFSKQHQAARKYIKYKFILNIESDHFYPENFAENLKKELLISEFYGISGSLKPKYLGNYFERGVSAFYKIHHLEKGQKELIAGPCMYFTDKYLKYVNYAEFNGYSADTYKAEIEKSNGLKVGLGHTFAYQVQRVNFKTCLYKYYNYGLGDYDFYSFFSEKWSFIRKIKSVTHVFIQYCIEYPLISIKQNLWQYIPFFWMIALVRYYGWISRIISNRPIKDLS